MFMIPSTIHSIGRNLGKAFNRKSAPAPTTPEPATSLSSEPSQLQSAERSQILMSFGLTERDLDFMGPAQRTMVEDVIGRVLCTHNLT